MPRQVVDRSARYFRHYNLTAEVSERFDRPFWLQLGLEIPLGLLLAAGDSRGANASSETLGW
jgi:hypothetical protein